MTEQTHRNGLGYHYAACGLTIESDLALPALAASLSSGDRDRVTIEEGPVPEQLTEGVINSGPNWERTANDFVLRVPGVARFGISKAKAITYRPEGSSSVEDLTAFLTGSVLGILLHLRGSVVLHASASIIDGGAVLFCGMSGAGKSTICAALGERGYALVSDDLCVLSRGEDGRLWVNADARHHKLWQRSLEGLKITDRKSDEVRHQIDKFYVPSRNGHHTLAPVRALYELSEQRTGDIFGIEPLSGPDAALMVRRNAFRPRMMWQLGQKADYFRVAAQLSSQGRIARFRRPFDFARINEGVAMLEQDWRTTVSAQ